MHKVSSVRGGGISKFWATGRTLPPSPPVGKTLLIVNRLKNLVLFFSEFKILPFLDYFGVKVYRMLFSLEYLDGRRLLRCRAKMQQKQAKSILCLSEVSHNSCFLGIA